jgi:hypothetical protein
MASDLLFCSGARTRTWNLRVMSFAPGAGASDTTSVFARLPVVPRFSRARMSSMARSTPRIAQWRLEVNRGAAPSQTSASYLAHHVPLPTKEVAYARTVRRLASPRKAKEHGFGRGTGASDVTWTPSRIACSGWGDTLRLLTVLESPARDWAKQAEITQVFERCPYNT